MELVKVKIKDIVPYEKNAKLHPQEQIEQIKQSIQEFGNNDPIAIDENNVIIEGHGRYTALKELGYEEVDCIILKGMTKKQKDAYRLVHNKLTMNSDFDVEVLMEELKDIETDMKKYDFDFEELEKEFEKIKETQEIVEDEFDETVEQPRAKAGQIYKLGRHRLMCGDSTKEENVEKLTGGASIDLVFTDPPYRMEAQGGSNQWVGRAAAKVGEEIKDLCNFEPSTFLNILLKIFGKKMNAYIFCNKDLVPDYLNWAKENKFAFNILFWKKPNALPLGEQHRPDVEYLIFVRKNSTWNNGLKSVTYSKCLEFNRDKSTTHPTMKPVGLIVNEVLISSKSHSNVLDLFGGSGSTLMACEQLDRNCYMMELDPHYVDVIIQRWEKFTGCKAELIE